MDARQAKQLAYCSLTARGIEYSYIYNTVYEFQCPSKSYRGQVLQNSAQYLPYFILICGVSETKEKFAHQSIVLRGCTEDVSTHFSAEDLNYCFCFMFVFQV